MARITSEVAGRAVGSLYDMVLIASRRVRELRNGHAPHVTSPYGDLVTAIQEIEEGHVGREYLLKPPEVNPERKRRAR
jgi:DNA-directed RNA polymerase subunit K/omega